MSILEKKLSGKAFLMFLFSPVWESSDTGDDKFTDICKSNKPAGQVQINLDITSKFKVMTKSTCQR